MTSHFHRSLALLNAYSPLNSANLSCSSEVTLMIIRIYLLAKFTFLRDASDPHDFDREPEGGPMIFCLKILFTTFLKLFVSILKAFCIAESFSNVFFTKD